MRKCRKKKRVSVRWKRFVSITVVPSWRDGIRG
jgi:hypothetical protein